MGVGGQRHVPAALHPGKTRYPLYRRLSGPQGRYNIYQYFSYLHIFGKDSVTPTMDCQFLKNRCTDDRTFLMRVHVLMLTRVPQVRHLENKERLGKAYGTK